MKELEILQKLTELVKMTLRAPKSKVKTQGELTMDFKVNKCTRQEDVLSTTLFNLMLENLVRKFQGVAY